MKKQLNFIYRIGLALVLLNFISICYCVSNSCEFGEIKIRKKAKAIIADIDGTCSSRSIISHPANGADLSRKKPRGTMGSKNNSSNGPELIDSKQQEKEVSSVLKEILERIYTIRSALKAFITCQSKYSKELWQCLNIYHESVRLLSGFKKKLESVIQDEHAQMSEEVKAIVEYFCELKEFERRISILSDLYHKAWEQCFNDPLLISGFMKKSSKKEFDL
ncbi:MAG: hypothetical protein V3581_04605 [Candidatus Cardinium sp.]